MDYKKTVLQELQPMFEEARKKGLWFYSYYQCMWFSPEELEAAHKENRFIWSKENWKLRDPRELLEKHREAAEINLRQYKELKARLS